MRWSARRAETMVYAEIRIKPDYGRREHGLCSPRQSAPEQVIAALRARGYADLSCLPDRPEVVLAVWENHAGAGPVTSSPTLLGEYGKPGADVDHVIDELKGLGPYLSAYLCR